MDKTRQQLKQEYESLKDNTRRFSNWKALDQFFEELLEAVSAAPPQPLPKWEPYLSIPEASSSEPLRPITFDPIDGRRIE